jgi:pantoate--beta-alanine ligase
MKPGTVKGLEPMSNADFSRTLTHPLSFVPTMGALHEGHLSLIRIAREYSPNVVVSIFVNPLQFENPDDLARYPRTLESDVSLAEGAGATYVWAPEFQEIYPSDPEIIPAGDLGGRFEGVHRFGHFDGVLTVVKRLFDLVQPEYAIFGEKDYQQLFLVKEMVNRLSLPVRIIPGPLIRESDGLAMSSRNIRLTPEGRKEATIISQALLSSSNTKNISEARRELHRVLATEPGFTLDYAEIINEETFDLADESTMHPRALVAGWVDGVRLIDNMRISGRE